MSRSSRRAAAVAGDREEVIVLRQGWVGADGSADAAGDGEEAGQAIERDERLGAREAMLGIVPVKLPVHGDARCGVAVEREQPREVEELAGVPVASDSFQRPEDAFAVECRLARGVDDVEHVRGAAALDLRVVGGVVDAGVDDDGAERRGVVLAEEGHDAAETLGEQVGELFFAHTLPLRTGAARLPDASPV